MLVVRVGVKVLKVRLCRIKPDIVFEFSDCLSLVFN